MTKQAHCKPSPTHGECGQYVNLVSTIPAGLSFPSTRSAWRTIPQSSFDLLRWKISIYILHMEGGILYICYRHWQPISIHTLHAEGDAGAATHYPDYPISIHTLCMKGDAFPCCALRSHSGFKPCPLHKGGRSTNILRSCPLTIFQSTPFSWRVTRFHSCALRPHSDFNP